MFRRTKKGTPKAVPAPSSPLAPGTQAPGFQLAGTAEAVISPGDFQGRPVVLVFYPADWSPVCGDQLALYNEILPLFEEYGAQVLAISVDGIWCHKAFAESRSLGFPLLSDFEPKGAVARSYGAFDAQGGVCKRALFVLDAQGTIRWSHVSPSGVNPGADGILHALGSL